MEAAVINEERSSSPPAAAARSRHLRTLMQSLTDSESAPAAAAAATATATAAASTAAIEDLMLELKERYTIVIVTHNMQQAARVSDRTAFFTVAKVEDGKRIGELVEFNPTEKIFSNPDDPRTEQYVTGKFG